MLIAQVIQHVQLQKMDIMLLLMEFQLNVTTLNVLPVPMLLLVKYLVKLDADFALQRTNVSPLVQVIL